MLCPVILVNLILFYTNEPYPEFNFIYFIIADVKHKCPDCLMLVKKLFNLDLHAKLGHVTPTGKEIFFSPSQRKIDKKPFKPEYITGSLHCR